MDNFYPGKEKDSTPEKVNLGRIHEYEAASGDKRGSPGFSDRYKKFITSNNEESQKDWWTKGVEKDVAKEPVFEEGMTGVDKATGRKTIYKNGTWIYAE